MRIKVSADVLKKQRKGMQRAYSVLEIKDITTNENGERIFTGIASTPETDRMGDVVVPEGAEYQLPIPLLWQHNSHEPVGWVTSATVTSKGIEVVCKIATIITAGKLKDMVDFAWDCITNKLVRGLSIGFNPIEAEQIAGTWSYTFNVWEWLELSAVTIPANAQATIQSIKAYDKGTAASGNAAPVVRSIAPGASGKNTTVNPKPLEGTAMNIKEQIKNFEATRAAKAARMVEIMEKASKEGCQCP